MSEFIASAEIAIIPNTRGFRNALIAELKAMKEVPVRVKVTPDTKGFSAALRKELKAMKLPTASVLVRPDMTGFRTALQAAVTKSSKGVVAQVGATVGSTKQAAGGGGGGSRAALTAQQQLTAAQDAAAFARKRIIGDFTEEERRAQSLAREKAALTAAQKAETLAIKEGSAALAQQAAQLTKTQAAAVSKREGTIARKAAEAGAPAARVKAAEAAAAAELKAQRELGTAMAKDTEKRLAAQLATQKSLGAAMAKDVENQIKEESRLRKKAFTDRQNEIKQLAKAQLQRPSVVAAQAAADKEAQLLRGLNRVKEAGLAIDDATIGTTTKLAAAKARLAAAETNAKALAQLRRTAEQAGLKTTAAAIILEQDLAKATLQSAIADEASAKAEAKQSKSRAFGARGAGAQLATFAGLRGAVLSANAAFIAGTVAAIAFGKAIQSAAQFESQLNVFRVVSGATADEMVRVSETAKRLGADLSLPGVSAGQAADAIARLSKAGLTVDDSIGAVRGTLQLSTAAAIDQAAAVELVASALNAFNLEGTDAVHVADVFANAANLAQGSIEDVAIAMQQTSAVARQFGVSFEDTAALLTLLQRAGIKGSDAGTSLRVAFTRLTAPTNEAAEALARLNVQVLDAQGNLRPEVFAEIATAQQNLSKAQQNANAKIIFGVDALRAYSIISREGLAGINSTRDALNEQGSAAELAAARMVGLTGKVEALKNQLQALGLSAGESLVPALSEVAKLLTQIAKGAEIATTNLGKLKEKIAEKLPGEDSFLDKLVTGSLADQVEDAAGRLQRAGKGVEIIAHEGPFITFDEVAAQRRQEQIEKAQGGIRDIFNKLRLGKTPSLDLHKALTDLDKLAAEFESGGPQAQKYASAIRSVRTQLSTGVLQAPFAFPKIEVPDLLGGVNLLRTAVDGLTDAQRKLFVVGKPEGLLDPGTIDVLHRKVVAVGDQFATLRSIVVKVGKGKFAVIPSIVEGAQVTEREARSHYEKTGEHLGIFTTKSIAKAYARGLSEQQGALHASTDGVFRPLPKTAAEAFAKGIKGSDIFGLGALFIGTFADGMKSNFAAAEAAVADLFTRLTNQILGLNDAMNVAILAGNKKAQIAVQKDIFATNQRIIDTETARIKKDKLTSKDPGFATATERIRAARAAQVAAQGTIEGIEAGLAADAKKKSDDIKKSRDAADKALLESFAPSERRLERRTKLAERTPGLKDDIAVARLRKQQLLQQIRVIDRDFKDRKAAQEEMFTRRQEILDIEDQIAQDQLDQAKGIKDKRQKALQAFSDLLGKRLQLAQLIGLKDPILRAFDKAIANARARVKNWKKLGLIQIDERIALQQLINDRKDFLEQVKDSTKQGLTAFELLKQNVETFNQVGGNLIQGNQPFAGPTGFTADVAQWLVARKREPEPVLKPGAPGGKNIFNLNDQELIAALDRLTQATLAKTGNQSTAVEARQRLHMDRWKFANQTRDAIEANNG